MLQGGENRIEGLAGAEGGVGFLVVGLVVAADVDGTALDGEEFSDDFFFVGSELLGDGGEEGLEFVVAGLGGEGLGPVEGEVEVAAAVVDGAEFAAGAAVEFEEFAGGGVEGVGEDFGPWEVEGFGDVFEAGGEGEEFTETVPTKIVFFEELLDVFGGGAAGAGFEEAATVHEGDDAEHFGAGADFENWEEVGVVVAQDVAGDGDGVFAFDDAFEAGGAGFGRGEDAEVEAGGVVVFEVGFDFGDELGVVSAGFVEPEDGGSAAGAGAFDGEFYPVLDGGVFGLAGAPDVASFDVVGKEDVAVGVDDFDFAVCGDFEGFVVGAVFFGGLGHEADVGDGAHGFGIEGTVGFAEVDGGLVDPGIGGVGDDGEGVAGFALGVPDFAAGADHGGHGGVDDDVGGDVEIGDAFVGVDHAERRAVGVGELDVGLDFGFFVRGEFAEFGDEVTEAIVEVDAEFGERRFVFGDEVFEEDFDGVAEDDGVGDLHHGGFHVQGEEDTFGFGDGDLFFDEGGEGLFAHEGGVDDFTGFERGGGFEDFDAAVFAGELDFDVGGGGDGDGFFVGEEVASAVHGADGGFRVGGPKAHGVGVGFGVVFDGFGGASVGVAFAEDGIDGGAHDFGVAGLDVFVGVGAGVFGKIGERVAFRLQFGDGGFELGD